MFHVDIKTYVGQKLVLDFLDRDGPGMTSTFAYSTENNILKKLIQLKDKEAMTFGKLFGL